MIRHSSRWVDVESVYDRLTDKDREYLSGSREYRINPENIIYRDCILVNDIPVGFIDVSNLYNLTKNHNNIGIGHITIAIVPEYRNRGLAKKMCDDCIHHLTLNHKNLNKLRWRCNVNNTGSNNLAKSLGFKQIESDDLYKNTYMYSLNDTEDNDIDNHIFDDKFREIQEAYKNDEISLESYQSMNKEIYDIYYIERYSEDDMKKNLAKFIKRYKFVPLKNNGKEGYITVEGSKYLVDINILSPTIINELVDKYGISIERTTSTRQLGANLIGKDRITLDKAFFTIPSDKGRDALLKHEIGHLKMHNLGYGSAADKRFKTKDAYDNLINNIGFNKEDFCKRCMHYGMNKYDSIKLYNKYLKAINSKSFINTNPKRDEFIKKGNDLIKEYRKKHPDNVHLSYAELEADRYAANHSSERALRTGLKQYGKAIKKSKTVKGGDNDKINSWYKRHKSETKFRKKNLKNKDYRDSDLYK